MNLLICHNIIIFHLEYYQALDKSIASLHALNEPHLLSTVTFWPLRGHQKKVNQLCDSFEIYLLSSYHFDKEDDPSTKVQFVPALSRDLERAITFFVANIMSSQVYQLKKLEETSIGFHKVIAQLSRNKTTAF